jgi:hypothetical protein
VKIWDGEIFDSVVNGPLMAIVDPGPLCAPIKSFKLKRDEERTLVMTTVSDVDSTVDTNKFPQREAGTVRENSDTVTVEGYRHTVKLIGVNSLGTVTNHRRADGTSRKEEQALVSVVESIPDSTVAVHQLMEWVANIDTSLYAWPHNFSDDEKIVSTRTFKKEAEPIVQTEIDKGYSSRSCFELSVGGTELILGLNTDHEKKSPPGSGFILYEGFPSEDQRRKIRECLSFALGRPLVYLGYTLLAADFSLLGFRAVSTHGADRTLYALHTLPPAPVSLRYQNMIDARVVGQVVNALFDKYDELNFRHLSWIYWHAVSAPVHAAPVQFGAAIESVQKAYQALNKPTFNTSLLKPADAKQLKAEVLAIIEAKNFPEPIKFILRNKAADLNSAPRKLANERFFKSLSLEMGEAEQDAWKRRNDAAHGNETDPNSYRQLIRDIKLLKNVLHRIVLTISAASDYYIDYYSLNFPFRKLQEAVPAQEQEATFIADHT